MPLLANFEFSRRNGVNDFRKKSKLSYNLGFESNFSRLFFVNSSDFLFSACILSFIWMLISASSLPSEILRYIARSPTRC